jgi:hypothetical protein
VAPAVIDLTQLKFVTADEPVFIHGDDDADNYSENDDLDDKTIVDRNTDAPAVPAPASAPASAPVENDANGDGGGNRTRFLDGEQGKGGKGFTLDFAVFRLPDYCASSSPGCDWAELGVGVHDDNEEGGISYCCSSDTSARGICDESEIGRLLVNKNEFAGDLRTLPFPSSGEMVESMQDAVFKQTESGVYVLIMANCNDDGREILTVGAMEWKSQGGNLPGDLFGLM